jgi:hypothetical protein
MESEILNKKGQFISTSGVFKTPFTLIILLQLYVGVLITIFANLWYWNNLYYYFTDQIVFPFPINDSLIERVFFICLIPFSIYGCVFLFVFSIILFSVIIFKILNKLSPPKEGIFLRDSKEWKYVHRKFWTVYFPVWLARALPIPWADIFAYRFFGLRIGKNVVLYEGYVDPYFIEIGDFTMTSLNICIFSHLIYQDKLFIQKVKIGEACVIGPQTIVAPGTQMEDRAILGANSYSSIGQKLESDLIHVGTPVNIKLPLQSVEDSQQKVSKIKESPKKMED